MAENNIQERVERSIFEAIRLQLVSKGWCADIANIAYHGPDDKINQANWDLALSTIRANRGFAIEIFGHSSSQSKGTRKTPRITIITRRVMPGDIGQPVDGGFFSNPTNPLEVIKVQVPFQSSDIGIDINLTWSTSAQDRVLHQIINVVIGSMAFLPMYDDPTSLFFIKQYTYQDIPDTIEGETEKIYSYEIPDLYLSDGITKRTVAPIKEIDVEISGALNKEDYLKIKNNQTVNGLGAPDTITVGPGI